MEELALEKENDAGIRASGWRGCAAELADRQEQLSALNARWEQEKTALNRVGELKKRLDDAAQSRPSAAQRDGDLDAASPSSLYGDDPGAREASLPRPPSAGRADRRRAMVNEEVGPDDIAEVVAAWTGIPAGPAARGRDGEAAADGRRSSASG